MKTLDKNKIKEAANNYVVSNFLEECTMKQYIIDSFETGFELCQQVFEKKLRFIPVEEKLPPIDIPVILKFKDWQGNEMYQIYTLGSIERREHFLKTHLKFTEWRSFL